VKLSLLLCRLNIQSLHVKIQAMLKQWCVYICRCNDGTLYTGITNDIERRIAEHNSGNGGAKYTRPRRPVELVYTAKVDTRSMATKREYQIKRMPLIEKRRLVEYQVLRKPPPW
jgi:putative endonuclease